MAGFEAASLRAGLRCTVRAAADGPEAGAAPGFDEVRIGFTLRLEATPALLAAIAAARAEVAGGAAANPAYLPPDG